MMSAGHDDAPARVSDATGFGAGILRTAVGNPCATNALQGLAKWWGVPPWNPPAPRGGRPSPSPTPPDADQGGPDRARERRGPPVSDPSAAARVRVCRPAASGACRPRPPPASRRAGSGGWLARTVLPSAPGAGWTSPAPNAGGRRRGGRRPRPDLERRSGLYPAAVKGDGRGMGGRTPALATAHPAGLKTGPATRVRLSQIPASRTATAKSGRRR